MFNSATGEVPANWSWQLESRSYEYTRSIRAADAAQQLVRNRADRCGDLADVDRLGSLLADDDDLVARCTSVPVTSIIVMSMQTDPTIGARRPRTSM